MVVRKVSDGFLVRLNKGELIMESLIELCRQKDIKSGWVTGLGGTLWSELAYYSLDEKRYEFDRFDEKQEISNLSGNIAFDKNGPAIHLHATLSDENYHAYAGHLKEAAVGGTCELYVRVFKQPVERIHNAEVGLKLIDLDG
ncbi:MAG: DUF296 domain-containing protein [Candidatus Saccharimonadales bacterium]|nr:DUF296 domain-containing protein [Candidatus Saccharimonadales bacterium]